MLKLIRIRSFHPFVIPSFHPKTQESESSIWEKELKVFVTFKIFLLRGFQIFLVMLLLSMDFILHLEADRQANKHAVRHVTFHFEPQFSGCV